jgi:hypothetical protein
VLLRQRVRKQHAVPKLLNRLMLLLLHWNERAWLVRQHSPLLCQLCACLHQLQPTACRSAHAHAQRTLTLLLPDHILLIHLALCSECLQLLTSAHAATSWKSFAESAAILL